MNWNDFEYSVSDGRPLTLYEFIRGGELYYRYTNADTNISVNGNTWVALAISDSGLSQNTGANLDITLPSSSAVVALYRGVPPSKPIAVRVHRLHYDDIKAELKTVWIGDIKEIKTEKVGQSKLITASLASTFTRNGLRLTYGRNCPHSLYDHNCRVNPTNYGVKGLIITTLDGVSITLNLPAGVPDGYFSGGYIEFSVDGITETRGAKTHTANKIDLFGGSIGLTIGMAITLYPGCDNTISTCNSKFKNVYNYGGELKPRMINQPHKL